MNDFQKRVLHEEQELNEKLMKLCEFIESDEFTIIVKDEDERNRLVAQSKAMADYSSILADRIANF